MFSNTFNTKQKTVDSAESSVPQESGVTDLQFTVRPHEGGNLFHAILKMLTVQYILKTNLLNSLDHDRLCQLRLILHKLTTIFIQSPNKSC